MHPQLRHGMIEQRPKMPVNGIASPENTRAYSPDGTLQNPGNVLIAEPVILSQQECRPQLLWQTCDRIIQLFLQLITLEQTFRRGDITQQPAAIKILGFSRISTALRPPATGLKVIFCGVHRNTVQPGIKGTVTTKAVDGPVSLDERFLGKVHDLLTVVNVPADDRSYPGLIFDNQ